MNQPSERNREIKRATLPEVQINFHPKGAPNQDPRRGDPKAKCNHAVNAVYGLGHASWAEEGFKPGDR